MARQRSYSFFALFSDANTRDKWIEAHQPEFYEGEPPTPLRIDMADTIPDGDRGFFEGSFARVLGADKEAVTALIEAHSEIAFDPRMSGFSWTGVAEICQGDPGDYATGYTEGYREKAEWKPDVGGGDGGIM